MRTNGWLAAGSILLLGGPLLSLAILLAFPELDRRIVENSVRVWMVSCTTVAAALAFAAVMLFTRSFAETRLLFLGLAFLSIAAIFSVHGLGTSARLHDDFHAEIAVSSWLSVTAGSLFVAASVLTLPPSVDAFLKRRAHLLAGLLSSVLGVYIGLSIVSPNWLSSVPFGDREARLGLAAVNLVLLSFSAWRYLQAYLFARLAAQWGMVCALVLLMEVQLSLTFGTPWHLSWWLYHFTYSLAFLVIFASWAHESRRAGGVQVLADALSMRDAIVQLSRGHRRPVAELIDAIEWKDAETLAHARRVAAFAVMTGKEMGLTTLELRHLALGAQMHDVGKLGVPDRILTKLGSLTDEEFAIIREHVDRGYRIASNVIGLNNVTDAIRYHHERYDGRGYPEGLSGEAIPLHARIVAVVDAYDAMTSGQTYRHAMDRDEACDELLRCAGSHFDPFCVEAFLRGLDHQEERRAA